VPQIARAVEVNAPVETIEEQWQRFEDLPRCAAHTLTVNVKWRAEVLTFEPIRTGTRITLKVEYEPGAGEAVLPSRLDAVLQSFVAFLELGRGRFLSAPPA
jgi:hypothetical protein